MSLFRPNKRLNKFIESETFEPTLNWGIRMGVAAVVPVIWGMATGNMHIAEWITITAECICWVELRGSAGLRLRILVGGTLLAFFFALLGCITGFSLLLSILGMVIVGFISSLFKNLGDRGSGLAICAYVLFIICNAYPPKTLPAMEMRVLYIFIGGVWSILVGMAASAFVPEKEPFRRSIALIWKSISGLIQEVSKGWDGKEPRSGIRDIYLKEKNVRAAIDNSIHFHETLAHQFTPDEKEFKLIQTRKATSLVAAQVIAISEEIENYHFPSLDNTVKLQLHAHSKALQQVVDRMATYVLTLNADDELLLESRMHRLKSINDLLSEHSFPENSPENNIIKSVLHHTGRVIKLIESCINNLQTLGSEEPIYHSYSLIKAFLVLHPKYLLRNIRLLFHLNSLSVRYALRTALASALAVFIYKWFKIDHGYWLPFTVILVIQPYFTATYTKAIDRTVGTVLGGLAGGLILRLPEALHLKEIMMFVCAVLMVYYLRRKYSAAAFFITLSLVLLFSVEEELSMYLLLTRMFCTVGGAAIGIIAGFILLPTWDKKWLPRHIVKAITSNYHYYMATFFPKEEEKLWTKHKRQAEIDNSTAFDSFTRYLQEPTGSKKAFALYYQLITHNVRITRELNNIHLEQESRSAEEKQQPPSQQQQLLINECMNWFGKNIYLSQKLYTADTTTIASSDSYVSSPYILTPLQENYLGKMLIDLKSIEQDLLQIKEET